MDPVAHTLFGAALAETGTKRLTRYATATLIIGANLPDVDVIAHFWGDDAALLLRRGWSHGVLALVLLPFLLTAAVWLWHRWRGREGPPPRMKMVLALSFLGVWSHALLDWMNTYGVRLLMPFDGRWFYGDTLFIVDPWVWLLTAAGVVLARSRGVPARVGWLILATLASLVILGAERAPTAVKLLWLVGIAAIIALRWRRPAWSAVAAKASFATLVIYVCAAYGLARVAESTAAAAYPAPLEAQANPMPGLPHAHRVVLVYPDRYRVLQADGDSYEVPRQEPDEIVRRALADPSIRGFATWTRYPYWQVEESADGWFVTFRDLRYVDPDDAPSGIGYAQVYLKKDLSSEP